MLLTFCLISERLIRIDCANRIFITGHFYGISRRFVHDRTVLKSSELFSFTCLIRFLLFSVSFNFVYLARLLFCNSLCPRIFDQVLKISNSSTHSTRRWQNVDWPNLPQLRLMGFGAIRIYWANKWLACVRKTIVIAQRFSLFRLSLFKIFWNWPHTRLSESQ